MEPEYQLEYDMDEFESLLNYGNIEGAMEFGKKYLPNFSMIEIAIHEHDMRVFNYIDISKISNNSFDYLIREAISYHNVEALKKLLSVSAYKINDYTPYLKLAKNESTDNVYELLLKYEIVKRIVDTSMAFKDLSYVKEGRLDPFVLENIVNHAYNTQSTLGLYETMELIEPIIRPTPGVTRARRHKAYKSPK
jgi:hypothetical protein